MMPMNGRFRWWIICRERTGVRPHPFKYSLTGVSRPEPKVAQKRAWGRSMAITANKLARIRWAVLASGNDYQPLHKAAVFSN